MRYRSHLESGQLSPGTINLRLGAVRRLPYEAADCGLLSADLAAGHSSSQRGEEAGRRAPRVRSSFSYRISRCDCWASSFSKSARSGICLICFSSNPSSRKKESAGGLKVVALRRPCSHCPCDRQASAGLSHRKKMKRADADVRHGCDLFDCICHRFLSAELTASLSSSSACRG